MKVPITITVLIISAVSALTYWISNLGLQYESYLGLTIGAWASAGALISATFIVYGYLINARAFAESQKPKVLLFVENGQTSLIETGEVVHETRIHYRNIGTVECEKLSLSAKLIGESEEIDIPRLFSPSIHLQIGDSRVRSFPTASYLLSNGISRAVVDNLARYKLRVGYRVLSLGKFIERSYDYTWDLSAKRWNIA